MKQKLTALLLVLCMVMAFVPAMALASAAEDTTGSNNSADTWDGATFTEPTSGTGTADDPILLTSAAEFMWFRNQLTDAEGLTKHYKLTVNVNFKTQADGFPNASNFRTAYRDKISLPASCATGASPFAGVLDGGNHIISNFYPNETATQSLLGIVSGTVKNLTMRDATLELPAGRDVNSGGALCYKLSGATVENCHVKNTTVRGGIIGGIASVAEAGSTIRNCTVDATLNISSGSAGAARAGGIVADFAGDSTIADCVVSGQINGNNYNNYKNAPGCGTLGGLVASMNQAENGTITNCVNNAAITGGYATNLDQNQQPTIGGILAMIGGSTAATGTLTVTNCKNNGTLTQLNGGYIGGIIGRIVNPGTLNVKICENTGAINAITNVGGIIGHVNSPNSRGRNTIPLTQCSNGGTITASGDNVGGMIGFCSGQYTGITLTECLSTGDVTGANNAGGLIGITQPTLNSSVIASACNVQANVKATGNYAGLAVGYYKTYDTRASLTVQNSFLRGQVTAAGNAAAIIGAVGTDKAVPTPTVKLMNTYVQATVTVDADAVAGTIAGGATEESITGVTLTVNGSKFAIQVVVGGSAVEAPNAYYNYAGEGTAVALDALDTAEFTNGTAVSTLNNGLETVAWIQGTQMPELIAFYVAPEVPEITIDGASLTIGRNVTLNLFVKTETIRNAGVTVKTISIVNNDGKAVANGELKGTNYVFTIEGLKAAEFGTNKVYKVQYTTEDAPETPVTCTETITYSPLQYAINMYGKTDKAGLDEMLISLVNYADAAAKNTNASTAFKEKHADADMTGVTAMETIVKEDTGKYTYDAKTMPGISATLTNAIELKVVPNETYTDVTVKVGEEIIEKNGNGAFAFYATDLYNEITFTFTGAEGTEPLTATTSLVQFLNAYAGTDYEAQATATAQYLYAARNFCLKNQTNA